MGVVDYLGHDLWTPERRQEWTPFGTWIRWYYRGSGFARWRAGENLAYGPDGLSAREVMRRWLSSPGHRGERSASPRSA